MLKSPSIRRPQIQPALSRSGLSDDELRQLVRGNEALFMPLGGASILITGATGWFGVWLLDLFCAADILLGLGIRITATSREPRLFLDRYGGFADDSRITWVKTDIRQLAAGRERFSHVIHAAADTLAQPGSDAARQLFETIVEGTRRVIEAAGDGCRSVLLLSSGAVYGRAKAANARFAESEQCPSDAAAEPTPYAEGKRAAEKLGMIAGAGGVPIRIARCFAFVGPHMPFDRHFAIGNFIADAVRGRPIQIKSDGRPERSYLYMTDLMRALLLILNNGIVARPYNVGSDSAISIEELAQCVDRTLGGRGVKLEGRASDPLDHYVPDTTRIRTELGFVPEVALVDAVIRTAGWYRAQLSGSMPS